MTLSDALLTRSSCREFLSQPLSPVQRQQLEKAVEQCIQRSGLSVRLVCGWPAPAGAGGRSGEPGTASSFPVPPMT